MEFDVFISYSTKDQQIADKVCKYLEERGLRCFISSRDIPKGVEWPSALAAALKASRLFLAIFSNNYNLSMQVNKELTIASKRHVPLLTFKITDDLPVMSVLNGGKPCWILDEGEGVDVPIFSRYRYQWGFDTLNMVGSLDFGVPRQLDIPGVVYNPNNTIYARVWRAYLTDRYDVDTKVMRCKVHFDKMQVNQSLLRKFYYYGNALWVLNKITNYSLTTYDPVECEFIQVQDKSNYLTGQIF